MGVRAGRGAREAAAWAQLGVLWAHRCERGPGTGQASWVLVQRGDLGPATPRACFSACRRAGAAPHPRGQEVAGSDRANVRGPGNGPGTQQAPTKGPAGLFSALLGAREWPCPCACGLRLGQDSCAGWSACVCVCAGRHTRAHGHRALWGTGDRVGECVSRLRVVSHNPLSTKLFPELPRVSVSPRPSVWVRVGSGWAPAQGASRHGSHLCLGGSTGVMAGS